jgi:hypothetical protein
MDVKSMKLTLWGDQFTPYGPLYLSTTAKLLVWRNQEEKSERHTVCCQTQHDDREQDLHAAKAEDHSWSNHFGVRVDIRCRDLLGAGVNVWRPERMQKQFATDSCKLECK